MNLGIVYAATGNKYTSECLLSLESLMSNISGIPVTVFTNNKSAFANVSCNFLDVVELIEPKYGFQDKITALSKSPFEKTLFLDTDTIVLKNPTSLFSLLDRFDLAACLETYLPHPSEAVPESFPEFNTGVLALKTGSPEVKRFLTKWGEIYSRDCSLPNSPKHDQPAFREALYKSQLNFCTLSSDWNFFVCHPAILNAGADIKILHSRLQKNLLSSQIVKKTRHSRVFLPNSGCLHPERFGSADWRLDWFLKFVALPFRLWTWLHRKF
jgi:hypothetical protein